MQKILTRKIFHIVRCLGAITILQSQQQQKQDFSFNFTKKILNYLDVHFYQFIRELIQMQNKRKIVTKI